MSVLVNAMRTETEIREEIEALRNLTTAQLKEKYREVFGEETRSNHKQFLFRRIAWRIQAKKVDCVVVYKVDRLTRSLLDFARIMEVLDKHGASFVSVTQLFNKTVQQDRIVGPTLS
jgi:DNA invertase Pin-like site-specific DNA recombinase